jgi:predicted amidophosphoribosyltransferase
VIRALLDDLAAALLPGRCPGCGTRAEPVCDACAATMKPAPAAPPPAGLAWWTAAYAYAGVARELVARAKYRNERAGLAWAARHIARVARDAPLAFDVVTWVPASRARVTRGGVDHGEVLARAVARDLRLPAGRALRRGSGAPQTGLDARTRRHGPPLACVSNVSGRVVLVVDDVATTGGTLAAAARALHAAGAQAVLAATFARTPGPESTLLAAAYTPANSQH